jgi:ApbE superfamily uncharacterized protein (UPF0280 family)
VHDPLDLLILGLAVAFVVLWWRSSIEARDRANAAAVSACQEAGAQLLDGTVAFQRLRPGRDDEGRFALRRTYVFDYSDDGQSRRQGFVVLRGREVEIVGLGPTLVRTPENAG